MILSELRSKFFSLISFFLLSGIISVSKAQELEPRAYSNIPQGLNFIVVGYAHSYGSVLFDPVVPLDNANIRINGPVVGYARSIRIGNMSGKIDMIIPYTRLSGTADYQGQSVSRDVSGFCDPRVRMTLNIIGAPALPLSDFKDYRQKMIVGASLQIYMPWSQYDPAKLVNIGTNRFTIKPELGISRKFGSLFLDLAGAVALYTVNNDFFNGKTRSQEPIYSVQGHIIYNFKKGIWVSIDGTLYWGGRTTVDNIEGNDFQENSRLGGTLGVPLNLHNSLKLYLSTGTSTRTGSDYNLVGLAWQYRWGKDLPKSK